jgi:arylsulfatase A-like enzyme
MFSGMEWFPTQLAAAGDTAIKDPLKEASIGGKTFKVHLDGYNQLPDLTGQQPDGARYEFFYFDDNGKLVATHVDDWKFVWCEQRARRVCPVGKSFSLSSLTEDFHLRMDPHECADVVSDQYCDRVVKNSGSWKHTASRRRPRSWQPSSPIRQVSFLLASRLTRLPKTLEARSRAK